MKRNALSLWFAGLAVLGLLRTWAAVSRHGVDTMAALWLAGSAAILLFLPLLGAPPWKLQLAAFIVALIWAKHYQNISRLVRGTEKSWKQRDRAEE